MDDKALNKKERFICEMIWGGVPTDVNFVRNSNMFKEGIKKFESGIWNDFWKQENENKK